MARRIPLIIFLLFVSIPFCYAQKATINGQVTDPSNQPLIGATISLVGKPVGTTADETGKFTLELPAGYPIKVAVSFTGFVADTMQLTLRADEIREINFSLKNSSVLIRPIDVEGQSWKKENINTINPKMVKTLPGPEKSVEKLLQFMGGKSTSELSSTYSVRGGNYDENLVYINDFEVYRPLLVRSGQQEGLSIINPDMVEEINFSAGGFDAIYGDKLSSALDIKYKKPKKFGGSVYASLLGASIELENRSKNDKFYYMAGARYKSNAYLLKTFETEGDYKPSFTDLQLLSGYRFTKKFEVEVFANYAYNKYNLVPSNRETNFGTINDAKRFTVYFEGQEADRYEAFTGAVSAVLHANEKLNLKLISSMYKTEEQENFDILGQYFLDQLEADLGKENFGDVAFNLGVGSFLNHGRNRLFADIYSVEHKGDYTTEKMLWQWGVRAQHEEIDDKLKEWYYNDSAGFSIPSYRDPNNPQIMLNDVVIAQNNTSSQRFSGYIQQTWQLTDTNRILLTMGVRANYWTLNKQTVVSPRASIVYKPEWNKRLNFRAAWGFYYQPPFYREIRDYDGQIYPATEAQKSVHYVLGTDYRFIALGRDFKLTTEVYYKDLEQLIPYKVNDIRIRYLPTQKSTGYATGIDMRLFGEFVKGAESWASISILQTREDIQGDYYFRKFNAQGEEIISGFTFDQIATDSVLVEPEYIPRPADQRVNFAVFFQDFIPRFPTYKVQLTLVFGTSLPFGPPGKDRYKDILRTPTYRRVDIGFLKQLVGEDVKKKPKGKFFQGMETAWIGLDVFNLLDVSNVASYLWVTDVSNARKYAVPNYLTGRQINVKLMVDF